MPGDLLMLAPLNVWMKLMYRTMEEDLCGAIEYAYFDTLEAT